MSLFNGKSKQKWVGLAVGACVAIGMGLVEKFTRDEYVVEEQVVTGDEDNSGEDLVDNSNETTEETEE